MQEDSLSQKQEFLSKEILEAGYDPEQFQDFMLENSSKELDLNAWTLKDLKAIVGKFKRQSYIGSEDQKQVKEDKHSSQFHSDDIDLSESMKSKKVDDDIISVPPSVNTSLYKHFTYIKKQNFPELYNQVYQHKKPPEIIVKNFIKTVPNNIFKSSYIVYEIQTSNGWKVKRRFTDFLWFHYTLNLAYPGFPIPPIPEKTTIRSFDEKHIETRMMVFEKFLSILLYIPEICSDPILEDFLKIESTQEFGKAKKKYEENVWKQIKKDQVHSILGQDHTLVAESGIQPATINFYKQNSASYEKLNNQLWFIQESMKKLSTEVYHISPIFEEIQKKMQSSKKSDIFFILGDFTNQLGDHLSNLSEFIKEKLTSVWQYEKMYCSNLIKSMQSARKDQQALNNKHKSMVKVADDLDQSFTNSLEPNRPLKQYQILKQKFKLKLAYIVRQTKRHEEEQLQRIRMNWAISLRQLSKNMNKLIIETADQLTRTISLGEGKKLMQVEYIKKNIV